MKEKAIVQKSEPANYPLQTQQNPGANPALRVLMCESKENKESNISRMDLFKTSVYIEYSQ